MTTPKTNTGVRARVGWAIGSAVLLALAAMVVAQLQGDGMRLALRWLLLPAGAALLPAVVGYLDGRSRTPTALVLLAAGCVAATLLLGLDAGALCLFLLVPAATAWVVRLRRVSFYPALLEAALGGVVGALGTIAALGTLHPQGVQVLAADLYCNVAKSIYVPGLFGPLDIFVMQAKALALPSTQQITIQVLNDLANQSLNLDVADKVAIVQPLLAQAFGQVLPALALTLGVLFGGLAYYAPMFLLSTRRAAARGLNEGLTPVPPFATFRIPVYAAVSMWLVELFALVGTAAGWGEFNPINSAASLLLQLLMTLQAMALFSYLLNRKRVRPGVQAIILLPAALLFGWLMVAVGVVETIFNLRGMMGKVDRIRAMGLQVTTPEGMEALRKLEEQERHNDKDNDDREDDDQ